MVASFVEDLGHAGQHVRGQPDPVHVLAKVATQQGPLHSTAVLEKEEKATLKTKHEHKLVFCLAKLITSNYFLAETGFAKSYRQKPAEISPKRAELFQCRSKIGVIAEKVCSRKFSSRLSKTNLNETSPRYIPGTSFILQVSVGRSNLS